MNKKAHTTIENIAIIVALFALFAFGQMWWGLIDYNSFESNNTKIVEVANLVSLEKGLEMSGSFVLGIGTVDTDIVYYAYQELETDTYVLRSFKTGNWKVIKLIESDTARPQYVEKQVIGCKYILWVKEFCMPIEYEYELIVPRGTIRRQFNG